MKFFWWRILRIQRAFLPTSFDFETRFFIQKFKRLTGTVPSRLSAETFDVAMMITNVLKKFKNTVSRPEVAKQLRATKSFPGVTGEISYSDMGFRKKPKLIIVRSGKFRELRR